VCLLISCLDETRRYIPIIVAHRISVLTKNVETNVMRKYVVIALTLPTNALMGKATIGSVGPRRRELSLARSLSWAMASKTPTSASHLQPTAKHQNLKNQMRLTNTKRLHYTDDWLTMLELTGVVKDVDQKKADKIQVDKLEAKVSGKADKTQVDGLATKLD